MNFAYSDEYMLLKMFIDSDDDMLKHIYSERVLEHNEKMEKEYYDAGFDLLNPEEIILDQENNLNIVKINHKIKCSSKIVKKVSNNSNIFSKILNYLMNCFSSKKITSNNLKVRPTGYYLYPRSSISKLPLRLANNTGIIDSGYRGNIIGVFDVNKQLINNNIHNIEKYQRILQLCAPNLIPIIVEIVNDINELDINTERGEGGFGSTGL
jgi:hypothetical protein